jgi:hypothetical protein
MFTYASYASRYSMKGERFLKRSSHDETGHDKTGHDKTGHDVGTMRLGMMRLRLTQGRTQDNDCTRSTYLYGVRAGCVAEVMCCCATMFFVNLVCELNL